MIDEFIPVIAFAMRSDLCLAVTSLLDPTMRRDRLQPTTPHENPVGVAFRLPPERGAALFAGRFSGLGSKIEIARGELAFSPPAFHFSGGLC